MRRASSKEISMTFLTRDVGLICWMMIRSLRPSTDSIVWRTFPLSTPRLFRTLLARSVNLSNGYKFGFLLPDWLDGHLLNPGLGTSGQAPATYYNALSWP